MLLAASPATLGCRPYLVPRPTLRGWRIRLAADEPHEYQHDYEDDHGVDDDGATDHPNHPSSDFRLGFREAPQEVGLGLTEVRPGIDDIV